jgi:hypothetical protein
MNSERAGESVLLSRAGLTAGSRSVLAEPGTNHEHVS